MGRKATETDNHAAHRLLCRLRAETLSKKHPKVASIIAGTIKQQLPRQFSPAVLLCILRSCPVITTRAAAEATGHRYARSSIAEYTRLARLASADIADYLGAP